MKEMKEVYWIYQKGMTWLRGLQCMLCLFPPFIINSLPCPFTSPYWNTLHSPPSLIYILSFEPVPPIHLSILASSYFSPPCSPFCSCPHHHISRTYLEFTISFNSLSLHYSSHNLTDIVTMFFLSPVLVLPHFY